MTSWGQKCSADIFEKRSLPHPVAPHHFPPHLDSVSYSLKRPSSKRLRRSYPRWPCSWASLQVRVHDPRPRSLTDLLESTSFAMVATRSWPLFYMFNLMAVLSVAIPWRPPRWTELWARKFKSAPLMVGGHNRINLARLCHFADKKTKFRNRVYVPRCLTRESI